PHRLRRGWPVRVELDEDGMPVIGRAQLARATAELLAEQLDLLATSIAERARVEVEHLGVAQDVAVPIFAKGPVARRARAHLVEEGRVPLVGRTGDPPGFRKLRAQVAIGHFSR